MKAQVWIGFATGLMLAFSTTAAWAQQSTSPAPVGSAPRVQIQPDRQHDRNNLLPEMTFRASQEARTPEQIERVNRANQLAALVDEGRCDEALKIAREARDRHMALRVRQLCH
ncbi:MAG: hypothetical protein ACK4NU_00925 [Brevundimonas sp.]